MEITERQKQILCQIVEEYAETASPVGSMTMAKLFNVSPATIRAEMARLETLGLIAQPHTSAGRVPTDAGYRFYVNNLANNLDDEPVVPETKLIDDGRYDRGLHAIERRVTSQSQADAAIRGAVDILVEILQLALEKYPDIQSVVVAGGVSANKVLREALPEAYFPAPALSGDNGAMVAAACYFEIQSGAEPVNPYSLNIYPRISIEK